MQKVVVQSLMIQEPLNGVHHRPRPFLAAFSNSGLKNIVMSDVCG